MPAFENSNQLILAILKEAKNQDLLPLLKTTLIKFLYLLDLYYAEENEGNTLSGWDWKFVHYGPYAFNAGSAIDSLVAKGVIYREQRESEVSDKEYCLFRLPSYEKTPDLQSLGLSNRIQINIKSDIKRYSKNLPHLLNHVYFHTAPMDKAIPGASLNFAGCEAIEAKDLRPVEMKKLSQKSIKKTREKLRALIKERKSESPIQQGPFDEAYFSAVASLDGEPLEQGLKGRAELVIN